LKKDLFSMKISLHLYGTIAHALGGRHIAMQELTLGESTTIGNLLKQLGLQPEEIGLVFVNAVLHDLPGLHISLEDEIHDGDHLGIFASTYVWPYHYRGGAPMSPRLAAYTRTHDYLRHHPPSAA
jgi:sulfur carrier protein ThiS